MRRLLRALRVLLLALFVLLGGAGLWLYSSLPQTDGRIALEGLAAPVTIERDAAGVPRIVAANDADAAFALGYLHAQDRLFQMEMTRRLGAGRLSEVLGPQTLS